MKSIKEQKKIPVASEGVLINPQAHALGSENAILTGTNRHYYVPDFEGCLSVKTVVSGSALWGISGREFIVHENSYLVLNDRQHYTMTIESARPATTFCLFFKTGFVEDVYRTQVTGVDKLLDDSWEETIGHLYFREKLETQDTGFLNLIRKLRQQLLAGNNSRQEIEAGFYKVAEALLEGHQQIERSVARLPAIRTSTREELFKRLLRGRDFILSSLDNQIVLSDMARAACLSPYHFHRAFTKVFGETPHRYLTRQRLEKAQRILANSDRSVTEVCLESGFESPGSFSSLFTRHYGLSPREFQKQRKRN